MRIVLDGSNATIRQLRVGDTGGERWFGSFTAPCSHNKEQSQTRAPHYSSLIAQFHKVSNGLAAC